MLITSNGSSRRALPVFEQTRLCCSCRDATTIDWSLGRLEVFVLARRKATAPKMQSVVMSHPTELCVVGVDEGRGELVQSAGRDDSLQASSTRASSLAHRPGRSEPASRAPARERSRRARGKSADGRGWAFRSGHFGLGTVHAHVHVGAMRVKVRAPSLDPASTVASAMDHPLTAPGWRRERSSAGPPRTGTRTQVHCQTGVQTHNVMEFEARQEGIWVGVESRGQACRLAGLPPEAMPQPAPRPAPNVAVNDVPPSNGAVARKLRRSRPGRIKFDTTPASMYVCRRSRTAPRGLRHPF